ncbi:MAG: 3-deoxy-D-manno-octulosonic acid transferase, partial [Armatimonadetes bacterium]|nr:3-deoxy-D-manno-octulosonic acid transferase [Armatimonadota bacterium]
MRVLYNLFLLVLIPLLVCYYLYRVFGSGKSRGSWRQQMGLLPEEVRRRSARPRVWLQVVSVGEVVASTSIVNELKRLVPDVELVISTTTATGQEMARRSIPDAEHVIYFPLDLPAVVRRSIEVVQPDVFVSVESEIWPNFLSAVRQEGIPALVVNGIISDRTYRWGMRLRPTYKWALSNVRRFLMQTSADAERIISLGAPRDRVEVCGNCKFDQENGALSREEFEEMRRRFGFTNGRRVFIAGSTNPGEEEPVLGAFLAARKEHPDLSLVLAPRQIDRAESIQEMVRSLGLACCRRSEPESAVSGRDVVILDTFGELANVYGIGDVAFVGGSLIPKGGHNILQPIAHGKPVLFGPFMHKARDVVSQAKAAGVGFEVSDGSDLGRRVADLLASPEKLEIIHLNAISMMERNRGASRRCAEAIAQVMAGHGSCPMLLTSPQPPTPN